jgi:hypothetical protein
VRNPSPISTSRSALALIVAVLAAIAIPAVAQAGTGGVGTDPTSGGSQADSGGSGDEAKYTRIWNSRVSAGDKRWAHETAVCESGKDPNAVGGARDEYRGAFMFLRSSWKNSPKSPGGDPVDYSYRTQAVVAVLLKKQMGTSPWPVCG